MAGVGIQFGPFPFRILYVDDDECLGHLYAEILRARGYEVHLARGGFEALAALRQSLPDLVISDLSMPDMSGLELLAIIRQRFPALPLMAMSGGDARMLAAATADIALSRGETADQQICDTAARLIAMLARRSSASAVSPLPWVCRPPGQELVIQCSECLRSFRSATIEQADDAGVSVCTCTYCGSLQRFIAGEEGSAA